MKRLDNKKEQERADLHRSIWNIANDLRGSVDGWDFKQYVLGMMFYRYMSEYITNYVNGIQHEVGDTSFDYAKLSDEESIKQKIILLIEMDSLLNLVIYLGMY